MADAGFSKIRLPSLNALKAFDVVMRRRSLSLAADELLVTPQAVGQQIRALEAALKVPLFEHKGRSIEPTEAAIILSHFVSQGFEEIAKGVRRVTRSTARERVNLNVSPFFAARHLLPEFSAFSEVAPSADLRLSTMVDMPDFHRDEIDLAIQWGYGDWPHLEIALLIPDAKVICCAPAIARGVRAPADLAKAKLLDAFKSRRLWSDILRTLGVEGARYDRTIGFDDAATMRRATAQGMGVGLLSELDADEDIARGTVVAPLGRHALAGMAPQDVPGFHLVAPKSHLRVAAVAKLFRWIAQRDWSAGAAPKRRRDMKEDLS